MRYLERQKQAEAYKRRVDVIDQLRANQTGPVSLLVDDWRYRQQHGSGMAEQHVGPGRDRRH